MQDRADEILEGLDLSLTDDQFAALSFTSMHSVFEKADAYA